MRPLFDRSDPLIQSLGDRLNLLRPFQQYWSRAVPAPLSQHSRPADYCDGVLLVWTDSPVWANLARHKERTIIEGFRSCGLKDVHSLRIRVAPPAAKDQHGGKSPRPPFSPAVSNLLQSTAHSIANSDLKNSLLRLAARLRGR